MTEEQRMDRDIAVAAEIEKRLAEALGPETDDQAFASMMAVLSIVAARKIARSAPGNRSGQLVGVHILARHVEQMVAYENERMSRGVQ